MITNEQAQKLFDRPTMEAEPTGARRLIIPAYGFAGGKDTKREEWGADGPFMEDVKGLEFYNDKDQKTQVLKAKDGCLICYDAPGRKEKIDQYIKEHPHTFATAAQVGYLIDFIKKDMEAAGQTPDLYDTDVNFAANLKDAPAREDIKPGMTFSGVKKKEVYHVVAIKEGEEFGGATAGKGGAYLRKDAKGDIKMIQKAEFNNAYIITKMPQEHTRQNTK